MYVCVYVYLITFHIYSLYVHVFAFVYLVPGTDFSKEIVGAPPHCDLNFITLLATDEIWGLQVRKHRLINHSTKIYITYIYH